MRKIFVLLLVLSLPAVWFLLTENGYEPHDLHHLADIYEMKRAIDSGQVVPRLGPDFLYGFGYPLFNYYYVLPFYLGAAALVLTGSLMTSLKFVFLLSALLSVFGMYLLLKRFFSSFAAIAGSVLYLYTPFRAVEIYVRGAIGEAFAIALLPWVLLVLVNLVRKPTVKNMSLTAFVLALFLLTHNYFFLLAAPLIGGFLLVVLLRDKEWTLKIKAIIGSGLLSAGLSAFWWLPAFLEYPLVAANTPFAIIDHFPFLKQLVVPSWGYGSSVWGPGDEISFQIGIVNLLVAALSIPLFFIVKHRKNGYKLALTTLVLFLGTIFMMNIRSLFVWNIIPFTNFIQFPWRLLAITTFLTAFLGAFVADNIKFKKLAAVFIILFSILLTFLYFRPSKAINRSNDEYLTRFFNNPQYSEDYLQLPLHAEKRPDFVPEHKFSMANGEVMTITEKSPIAWEAEVKAGENAFLTAYALNLPGWFVKLDGKKAELHAGKPYGQIELGVPPGLHTVELYWGETNLRLLADIISLASIIIVFTLYFRDKLMRAKI